MDSLPAKKTAKEYELRPAAKALLLTGSNKSFVANTRQTKKGY